MSVTWLTVNIAGEVRHTEGINLLGRYLGVTCGRQRVLSAGAVFAPSPSLPPLYRLPKGSELPLWQETFYDKPEL